MDAFSRLIELAGVRGSLDLRCQLAGSFSLEHELMPGGQAPFHLVLAGRAVVSLRDGMVLQLKAGDLLVLARGSAHRVQGSMTGPVAPPLRMEVQGPLPIKRNTDDEPELDLLCGRFTYASDQSELIMSALPEALHLRLAHDKDLGGLQGVASLLRAEVEHLQQGAVAIVNALSQALFVLGLRAHMQRKEMPASLLLLLGDARLSRAVLAMLRYPDREWTVASLAEQSMMSRATFARRFSTLGGTSPLELLTVLRMQTARNLLERGQLATGEVAERVGYQSEAAFGKVFTQRIGVTPAAFRRRHIADD